MIEAVKDLPSAAASEIWWITQLPAFVLDIPAPDDEEASALKDANDEDGRWNLVDLNTKDNIARLTQRSK